MAEGRRALTRPPVRRKWQPGAANCHLEGEDGRHDINEQRRRGTEHPP